MINTYDILETIRMIQDECLDIRTTTMGISLLDCADTDIDKACAKVYDKICTKAEKLVQTGEDIEREYGIPIINKRVSVTPIAIMAGISGGDPVKYALALEKASRTIGVNFIGGYSALVQKGFAAGDRELIDSIPPRAGRDGAHLLLRKHRFHQSRYQYGRGKADGSKSQGSRRADQRERLHRRRQAGGVLQRPGG